jgi:hypothetical protein
MGYIYKADVYCDDCGNAIRAELKAEGKAPEDELDHYSYDSDDYPKDADVENDESDCPQHCAGCGEFLHNPLTSDGYEYVQEKLNEFKDSVKTIAKFANSNHPALAEWASWYGFDYWTAEDCAENGRHSEAGWYSNEAY